MNCILIEKPQAQNQLKEYLNLVPYFNLVSYCTSVFDAYEILQTRNIDIVFVETELEKVSGIDFIKSLDHRPMVVLVSENAELAVEGYNLNAIDFLLKPFTFDRFLKTANKAYEYLTRYCRKNDLKKEKSESDVLLNKTVMVKTDYKTILIRLNEILYIEGLKDYIKIYTSQNTKPVITLNSLKKFQEKLPSDKFSRIHKSYIVGLDHINSINKTQVIIHEKYIPIGESYRNIFQEKMEEMKI